MLKKISNKVIIAIALLVIAGIVFYYQNIKSYEVEVQKSTVVVANEDIPFNTLITKEMIVIDERYTPDLLKQSDNITGGEENIIGKRTNSPIYKGEPISTKKLIENKKYMEDDDTKKRTMFTIMIAETDKSLNIEKNSYIDVWYEPNQNYVNKSFELGQKEPKPILKLEKYRVYDIKSDAHLPIASSSEDSVISYLTLYLTDEEILACLEVEEWNYSQRITLHGEHLKYGEVRGNHGGKLKEDETVAEPDTSVDDEEESIDDVINP